MGRATLWKFFALLAIGGAVGLWLSSKLKHADMASRAIVVGLAMLLVLGILGYAVWVLVTRNKKTIAASQQQKHEALKFQPSTGKGVLYVFRHQAVGLLAGMDLVLDGKLMGQTRGYAFYRLEVEPGKHQLSGDKKCPGSLEVEVAVDQVVFIEQELAMGALSTTYRYLLREGTKAIQKKLRNCQMMLPQTTVAASS
jgi:hypothetical protein